MSNLRKTALTYVKRDAVGGSYYDSFSHSHMFKKYGPYKFGVRNAQLFSSKLGSHLLNKKFVYMTKGMNNCFELPGGTDDYEWMLTGEGEIEFRITELLVPKDSYPGKGGLSFKIAIDREWPHEPTVLKTENANLPMLKILGHAKQRSANSFELEVKLQTGDLNSWIPVDYLMPGKKLLDATTSVSDELNTKYSGIHFSEMFQLQSWTGNFARKTEFTDKFIRAEIASMKDGRRMNGNMSYGIGGPGGKSYSDGAVGMGYVYYSPFKNLGNKGRGGNLEKVWAGTFVTAVEARLLERLERDVEMNMEFGKLEKTVDQDSNRPIKVPPGWRQIVRDGHFRTHNGSLTLSDLYEYIMEIFLTRRTFDDRKIMLATGEGGAEFFHRLVAQEASQFQYVDSNFLKSTNSMFHSNALEFGAQFTSIKLPMGVILQVMYDPIKDDRQIFPELAPGTNRTLESFAMDIFDFGATDQKAAGANSENITCVAQGGVESYFTVSNVYDFKTGAITDGSNAYSNNKEAGIYRETSAGLAVWDTTRVGRIEFNPYRVIA